jgi:hypothetical protein
MLSRRNAADDHPKAARLLAEALSLAERFEMPTMARRASSQLALCT